MLLNLAIISSTTLLVCLSLMHFYWLFGGRWGYRAAIPDRFHHVAENSQRRPILKVATLFVAMGLLAMAWLMFLNYPMAGSATHSFSQLHVVLKIIGTIFLARALGDGNILGLFKRKSHTQFAYYDSRLYIPICLFLGLSFWIVAW